MTFMLYTDGSLSPWGKNDHRKLMDIPTTYFRWVMRERPDMVEKYPGLADYIQTRIGAEGCVRSQTREARMEGPPRGKTPKELGLKSARKTVPPPARVVAAGGDLFALAAAMREATK